MGECSTGHLLFIPVGWGMVRRAPNEARLVTQTRRGELSPQGRPVTPLPGGAMHLDGDLQAHALLPYFCLLATWGSRGLLRECQKDVLSITAHQYQVLLTLLLLRVGHVTYLCVYGYRNLWNRLRSNLQKTWVQTDACTMWVLDFQCLIRISGHIKDMTNSRKDTFLWKVLLLRIPQYDGPTSPMYVQKWRPRRNSTEEAPAGWFLWIQ